MVYLVCMSEEKYNQILDEAYANYMNTWPSKIPRIGPCLKEEFINACKTNTEFSETWCLKIEEQELTYKQRYKIWFRNNFETGMEYCEDIEPDFTNDYYEPTPTKLITVTYNNTKTEIYE